MKRILYLVITLILIYTSKAQHHDKEHQNHNEISVSNALFYTFEEESFSYGLHIHGVKSIFDHFGVGVGYECLFRSKYPPHFGQSIQYA
ncbi:hypothetical protein ACFLSQ_10640, partial [Bacteroidota bacterium]